MFEDRGSATLEAGDEAEDPAVDQRRDPTNRGGGGYRGNRDDNRAFPPTCKRDFFSLFFFFLSPPFDRYRSKYRSLSIIVCQSVPPVTLDSVKKEKFE